MGIATCCDQDMMERKGNIFIGQSAGTSGFAAYGYGVDSGMLVGKKYASLYHHKYGEAYGTTVDVGDVLTIKLEINDQQDKNSLMYFINGDAQGIAFQDMKLFNNVRFAVSLLGTCSLELL